MLVSYFSHCIDVMLMMMCLQLKFGGKGKSKREGKTKSSYQEHLGDNGDLQRQIKDLSDRDVSTGAFSYFQQHFKLYKA